MTSYTTGGSAAEAKLRQYMANLLKATTVEAGFMAGATEADGTSVPLVAALNEFGTSKAPPRPFFRNAIADGEKRWPVNLVTALKNNNYDSLIALSLVGRNMQEDIQGSIRKLWSPPLADSTIARKGFDKPLIETSTMLNSVTNRVK